MSEPGLEELITVSEAAAILDRVEVSPRLGVVPLAEALGSRLAEEVVTDRDYPPFDKALMDGFAVRAGEGPGEFQLVGEVHAGEMWKGAPLRGRQAIAIMTGAPVPAGDGPVGVVPVEESERGHGVVRLRVPAEPGKYISRRGADGAAGAVVLRPGTMIGPGQLTALASVGKSELRIYGRPRCAVLATGDELVPVAQTPEAHQIRNANSPMLVGLLERLGAEAVDGGHVRDDLDGTRRILGEWLESSCDCLFITGGMSMGERDYVPRVLRELGVEMKITKLRIKPGKPFVFGMRTRQRGFVAGGGAQEAPRLGRHTMYVFGLPGNPVSAYVCTLVLASRLIARLCGAGPEELEARCLRLPLAEALPANGARQFYQPARLERNGEVQRVRPLAWRGSGDVFTLAAADGLIERRASEGPRAAGEPVTVLLLP